MIHLIYLAISIICLIFAIWLYYRYFELFLCLLIVINFDFFRLLPPLGKFYAYRELLLPILAFCIVERFFFSKKKFELGRYGILVLFFLIMAFFGIVNAFWHGQPLILGVKAAKYFPLILIYFVVVNKEFDIDKFLKYLVLLSFLVSIVMLVQFFLWGKFYFVHFTLKELGKMRLGRPRIIVGGNLIALVGVISLGMFLKQKRFIYLLAYLYSFVYTVYLTQTRMLIFAMLICGVLLFILNLNTTSKVVSAIIVALCFAVPCGFVAFKYIRQIGVVKLTELDIKKKRGSFEARIRALKYYFNEIKKSPILGHGLINYNWEKSPFRVLQNRNIYLSDIGITSLLYKFGLMGGIWLILCVFMVFRDILKNRDACLDVGAYFLFIISVMATLDFFIKNDKIFLLGLFLGLLTTLINRHTLQSYNEA